MQQKHSKQTLSPPLNLLPPYSLCSKGDTNFNLIFETYFYFFRIDGTSRTEVCNPSDPSQALTTISLLKHIFTFLGLMVFQGLRCAVLLDLSKALTTISFIKHIFTFLGLMVFQGLDLALREQNKELNIVGAVLDSCPG